MATPDNAMKEASHLQSGAVTPENGETTKFSVHKDDSNNDDDCLTDMGFLFEAEQPSRVQHFDFGRGIQIQVSVAEDEPGAVQSGHYLWPAAELLAQYLVDATITTTTVGALETSSKMKSSKRTPVGNVDSEDPPITKILELGAGCAVASLVALQVWQSSSSSSSLKRVTVTDHDRGTLERARKNYAMTFELQQQSQDEKEAVLSHPEIDFEVLEWGDADGVQRIRNLAAASCNGSSMDDNNNDDASKYDLILGSDLIYCRQVVAPLFETAAQLVAKKGRFLLSQSFCYDTATEDLMEDLCKSLEWKRTTLLDDDDDDEQKEKDSTTGTRAGQPCFRVQEFRRRKD